MAKTDGANFGALIGCFSDYLWQQMCRLVLALIKHAREFPESLAHERDLKRQSRGEFVLIRVLN